ncbi:MAG: penicillin-binding protein 2, partial [Opitutales bacterium]|nr:penicillin-binding protein 2 [Opitutales bacterium]
IKGLRGDRKYVRVYPSGSLAAHVVGFVNKEFSAELGVEKKFDYYLRGQDGWIETERDGRREELGHFRSRDVQPVDGMNVEVSIDSIIQEIAQREVAAIVEKYNPASATIIVGEPSTGYVLAMASYPDFNPNKYNKYPQDNLRNRAICDQYEPGSTFKIVAISGALNESLVGPDDVFDCNAPTITYKGRVLRLPKEAHKMDKLSVREITKKSSNKGSAHLGVLLGERKLYHYAHLYGFGEKTDIGLSGEIAGTLHKVKDWDGLTITRLPMGHAVAATPLQVHCAMSVIANQGIYMQPQLVKRVFDKNGKTAISYPPKAVRRVISPKIATLMSEMLVEVVSETGTARRAALKGFKVAGKTGTSQKIINGAYSSRDHVASFSGFFPAQRPRLVITVVVDSPKMKGVGYGGLVAAPSFSSVAEQAANYLGIQTDEEYEKKVAWR